MNTADLRQLIDRLRQYAEFGRQAQELTYGTQVTTAPDDLELAATLLEVFVVEIPDWEPPVQGTRPS